ncbi:hypothetical protein [Olivibacter sitiensis]|nr:hypothetical protein [Olivibacter sitiensis]
MDRKTTYRFSRPRGLHAQQLCLTLVQPVLYLNERDGHLYIEITAK